MISSNSSLLTQWGKLTSLNPNFNRILLSENPSSFAISHKLCNAEIFSSQGKCQIYQDKENFFLCFQGDSLSVSVRGQAIKQNEALKIHSGEKITFIIEKQDKITMEYIFSGELIQKQKDTFKEEKEKNDEIMRARFNENLQNEAQCILCCKMIYECVSVVPCLHSFCMYCLMQHLKSSQECPQCDQRFTELRKNVFLNNIIEAYNESDLFRDRSKEECNGINEKLETERIYTRFEYANGDIYQGEWKKCRKEGNGKMRYKNGDVYEGEWKNNKMEGKGKKLSNNGEIYEGDWKNNKRNGKGKKTYKNGEFYEGDWKNDKRDGKGKMVLANGDSYKGDWKNHKREGKGVAIAKNGSIYDGDWKNNKRHGKGEQISASGKIYEGDWENDNKHGKGKLAYPNGKVYEGEWRYDKKNGEGKQIDAKGDIYKGNWKDGKRDGKGEMAFRNGDRYEGDWKNGEIHGKGEMIYKNGDMYKGDWKNNKREGQGITAYKNGDIYEGDWKNDYMSRIAKVVSKKGNAPKEESKQDENKEKISVRNLKNPNFHCETKNLVSQKNENKTEKGLKLIPRNNHLTGKVKITNNKEDISDKRKEISLDINIDSNDLKNHLIRSTGNIELGKASLDGDYWKQWFALVHKLKTSR